MRRIPSLHAVLLAGSIGALLVACGGKATTGKDGSGTDKLQSIDPSNVSGAVGACPAGYQHPNICCSGGPGAASTCGAYVNHPFRACDQGWSTHPNPLSCCSLTDGTCIDAPSGANDLPAPPPSCGLVCPPGWWPASSGGSSGSSGGSTGSNPGYPDDPPPVPVDAGVRTGDDDVPPSPGANTGSGGGPTGGYTSDACCQTQPSGSVMCFGVASAGSVPPSPPTASDCAVGYDVDAGVEIDAGCNTTTPDPYPPSPTPPPCASACPEGWFSDPAMPEACCRANPYGARECFINGAPPSVDPGYPEPLPAPAPTDAGVSPGPSISCGGAMNGSCSCTSSGGAHTYEVTCDDPSGCTCFVDGVEVKRLASDVGSCDVAKTRAQALLSACGFN
jgi:hypothetical protein